MDVASGGYQLTRWLFQRALAGITFHQPLHRSRDCFVIV